jgi:hypothetical protein
LKLIKCEYFNNTQEPIFRLSFPYDAILLKEVKKYKEVVGKKIKGKFYWDFPVNRDHLYNFLEFASHLNYQFKADSDLEDYLNNNEFKKRVVNLSEYPIKRKLYPFQEKGVSFIVKNDGKAFLRDDPGMGKTTISLCALLVLVNSSKRALILAPEHLIKTWETEASLVYGRRFATIISSDESKNTPILLCSHKNYLEKLKKDIDHFSDYHYVVIDESQCLRNTTTKKYKLFKKGLSHTDKITFLNAFDLELDQLRFYGELSLIQKDLLKTEFLKRYFYFEKDTNTHQAKGNLLTDVKKYYLRRTAKGLFKNVSKVIKTPLKAGNYQKSDDLSLELKGLANIRISKVKSELLKKIKEFPSARIAVIFPSDLTMKEFSKSFSHPHFIGENHAYQILLFNAKVDSRGLNLDYCDICLDFSLSFEQEKRNQLIGRFQRISTTKTVQYFCYYLAQTIEERIFDIPPHLQGLDRLTWLKKKGSFKS